MNEMNQKKLEEMLSGVEIIVDSVKEYNESLIVKKSIELAKELGGLNWDVVEKKNNGRIFPIKLDSLLNLFDDKESNRRVIPKSIFEVLLKEMSKYNLEITQTGVWKLIREKGILKKARIVYVSPKRR